MASVSWGMHLYAAFLGGSMDGSRMGEDHEVVLIVAEDQADASVKAKAKWRGRGPATSTRLNASRWSTASVSSWYGRAR